MHHTMGQGIDGTPLLPLRGNDRDERLNRFINSHPDSILHAVSATEVRGPCDL